MDNIKDTVDILDISYRDDIVEVCGDIHGEFATLVFNIVQKKIENATVIVAGDCGFGFNKLAYYDELYKKKLHNPLAELIWFENYV